MPFAFAVVWRVVWQPQHVTANGHFLRQFAHS